MISGGSAGMSGRYKEMLIQSHGICGDILTKDIKANVTAKSFLNVGLLCSESNWRVRVLETCRALTVGRRVTFP